MYKQKGFVYVWKSSNQVIFTLGRSLLQLSMVIIFGFGRFGRTLIRMYEKVGKKILAYDPYISVRKLWKILLDSLTVELLDKVKIFRRKADLKQAVIAEVPNDGKGSDLVYVFFAVKK